MSKNTMNPSVDSKEKVETTTVDSSMPDLSMQTILAMTFGCIGVNMAFTLQGSQMSRITQTIGVNPNSLGFFFLLPPLLGMVVQPLLGKCLTRPGPVLAAGSRICCLVRQLLPL